MLSGSPPTARLRLSGQLNRAAGARRAPRSRLRSGAIAAGDLFDVGEVVAVDVDRRSREPSSAPRRSVPRSRLSRAASGANRCASAESPFCVGQLPRPVQRQVEVAAAVVELSDLARRRAILLEHAADRAVERVGEQLRPRVAFLLGEQLERRTEREELAERVPAQMVLLQELLDVLGGRTPAPVSNSPPPCISGTIESIFALVPSSRIGNRSVR